MADNTIERLCRISPSQEDLLRHSGFDVAGEHPHSSSDGSATPVDPTGIRICSLESSDTDHEDEYHTPPEDRQIASSQETTVLINNTEETRACGSESAAEVELGGDTDLVLSEDDQGLGLGFSEKEGVLGSELGFQTRVSTMDASAASGRRRLPRWIDEAAEGAKGRMRGEGASVEPSIGGNPTPEEPPSVESLMELLNMMGKGKGQGQGQGEFNGRAEDILEVMRRKGMKIPRPRWWGEDSDPWRKDGTN
ncbi:hypothetical protein Sjap_004555 [Stephania japonica]|uniref:Uncharacterized protein n=1 Tax=Stephania japonica TaxID=461633 RepID=A0AAP0PHX5_9MAGN